MSNRAPNHSYSSNDANISGSHLAGDPLFEMPPFPPWSPNEERNTHERSLSTPLQRRTRRGLKGPSVAKDTVADDSAYSLDITRTKREEGRYDYHPFSNKRLITEGKVNNILVAESAEHCLVFHKRYHPNGIGNFRPDLNIDCEDKTASASPLLIDYPGMIKDNSRDPGARGYHGNVPDNVHSGSGNGVRKPATKMLELKVFWENSDLLNHIETDIIIKQNTLLQRELNELADIRKRLKSKPAPMPLREKCDIYLNQGWKRKTIP